MNGEGTYVVRFQSNVYDVETVKRAAYRFIDRFAPDIRIEGDEIVCRAEFAPPVSEDIAINVLADFRKEVLDQGLRRSISAETAAYRNTILALAFAPIAKALP